jgi:hypothetical protein
MRPRIVALVAAFSLLFSAGIASANSEETDPRGDTWFNFGYDAQAQYFLYGTHATESTPYDCTLANGTLTATYGKPDDGVVPVDTLTNAGGPVSLGPTAFELTDGLTPASADYDGTDGPCGISAADVGTKGHINHGQFMKLFNHLIDIQGRGCVNRWIAQSELGKGDQQRKKNDKPGLEIEAGIDFTTVIASCDHGKKERPEDHPGNGHARDGGDKNKGDDDEADHRRGRPGSPGNSGSAPGHNK